MDKRRRRFEALESLVKPKAKLIRESITSKSFVRTSVETIGLVLLYYTFSISLTFYNQRFIHAFRFPLCITTIHLMTKFMLAAACRSVHSCLTGRERVTLSWRPYVQKVSLAGIAGSLDIGLSNWSFEFITITLYTMTKSTAVVFILFFSLILGLEKMRCSLVAVVLCVAVGLFMFTFNLTQFNMEGFLMVLSAAVMCGLRWTLSQLIMQKSELGLSHPLDMMYHIQPWMLLTLLPLAVAFEGVSFSMSEHTFGYHDSGVMLRTAGLILVGALVAFFMELSEFLLVSRTSSLTISFAGVLKEVCTLVLAAVVNGDRMSLVNVAGLLLCLSGILLHVVFKAVRERNTELGSQLDESVEMLLINDAEAGSDGDEDEVT